MKLIIAIAAASLCSGCAVTPMTDEERAQNDRLIQALQLMQTGFGRPGPQPGYAAPATKAFFKRSYQSGMNRICIYDRLGSEEAITVSAMEICPISR